MPMTPEYRRQMAESANREEGDEQEFTPLDGGFYLMRVKETEETAKAGQSGYTQEMIVLQVVAPKAAKGKTAREWISYSPKSAWRMRELFDACDYTYDSDVSELVGEELIVELRVETQEFGKLKGQQVNKVDSFYRADDPEYKALVGK